MSNHLFSYITFAAVKILIWSESSWVKWFLRGKDFCAFNLKQVLLIWLRRLETPRIISA